MARCTYCKTKWKVKDVWSLLITFEKIVRIVLGGNICLMILFIKLTLPLLFLCPLIVDLSDENPLDKYRK